MSRTEPTIRGITRGWVLRPECAPGGLVERVLHSRGIDGGPEAEAFLNPSMSGLHDPSLIPDLDRAAERILVALRGGERVTIFGDYDVDGVTATAILFHLIHAIEPGCSLNTYIPHRVEEGYGLNADAIRAIAEDGSTVIVTVDCGITAVEPAAVAKELGVDLIITDHHNPPDDLAAMPDAFAVVHPRRPDSGYPFGELCGAGVAYKLAWRLATMHGGSERVAPPIRALLLDLLALAALGTIADIVPLVDENRVIVRHGLRRIRHVQIEGLHALIIAAGLDSDAIDTEGVGFRLAPRLNAVGRIGHAREALELMTTATGDGARRLAERLTQLNEDRRAQEQKILSQAIEMAEGSGMTGGGHRAIVLASDNWHPGIVGIVCSRLVDRYARPTILMCTGDGVCKGSGRSIEGFNLHAGLEACAEHLESFGGHDMAAGMKCTAEKFDAFRDGFLAHAHERLNPEDLIRTVRPDSDAKIHELTAHSIEQLERLSPFGAGNPRVRVRLTNLRLNGSPEQFGKAGNHLSLRVTDATDRGAVIRLIGWNWWRHHEAIPRGARLEVIVEPKVSRWKGNTRIEPILVDARVVVPDGDPAYSVVVGTVAKRSALN